jgi:hypothetical protein
LTTNEITDPPFGPASQSACLIRSSGPLERDRANPRLVLAELQLMDGRTSPSARSRSRHMEPGCLREAACRWNGENRSGRSSRAACDFSPFPHPFSSRVTRPEPLQYFVDIVYLPFQIECRNIGGVPFDLINNLFGKSLILFHVSLPYHPSTTDADRPECSGFL